MPIRIELGPRDIENKQYVSVRRDTLEKATAKEADLQKTIPAMLDTIHNHLFEKLVCFVFYGIDFGLTIAIHSLIRLNNVILWFIIIIRDCIGMAGYQFDS